MIPIIAWRNVWRNRTRSLVIIGSVMIGLWAGVFVMAVSIGITKARKEQMITKQISHIQIHEPAFIDRQKLQQYIPGGPQKLQTIQQDSLVKFASGRMLINGMLRTPQGSGGVRITGIYREKEAQLTKLDSKLVEGEYFPNKKNQVFVGKALAEKFDLKLGSKMVLTFQDTSANMVAGAFRICGLYKTANSKLEERLVYVRNDDLSRLLEMPIVLHEIALLAKSDQDVTNIEDRLQKKFPDLKVRTWKEISPELKYLDQMMDVFMYVFIGIILFALAFGLVNTMLMAVQERVRELGMMMAIGLTKTRLFFVILLETCYLAFTGTVAGFVLGWLTVHFTGKTGINVASVEEGMAEFGMSATLYPQLNWKYYPIIAGMVIVFAVLSAMYPAIKALKLDPAEAIRKI